MAKKKTFIVSDISTPEVSSKNTFETPEIALLISDPVVQFPTNPTGRVSFSFAKWYGLGFDSIVYICQVQVLRFLAKQDNDIEVASVVSICSALSKLFDYLTLRASALGVTIVPEDINRDLIDGYLRHLNMTGSAQNTQRVNFSLVKTALLALGQRKIITIITDGNNKTFPLNPFPNSNKSAKSATALTKSERQKLASSVRAATQPIWDSNEPLTSELLTYCVLVVALHTGRNTIPLLEMGPDCLKPHPKDNTSFLVLWKRRGHNTSKVILKGDGKTQKTLESMPSIRTNVERLIREVISRTALYRYQSEEFEDRIWLYPSREKSNFGKIRALTPTMMESAIKKLVADYDLVDGNGDPLKINISRLRKTFANRVFEILDGDVAGTARALGNTERVTDNHYLAASGESKKNWRFMGEILVQELLSKTIGATYHQTPIAQCSDNRSGRYVKAKEGICMSFLNCLRCTNFVITGDDLYKLFSFYFRIYGERARMTKQRWAKELSHIPRLIDHYIIAEGLKRGAFKQSQVDAARAQAQANPHPYWNADALPTLEVFA